MDSRPQWQGLARHLTLDVACERQDGNWSFYRDAAEREFAVLDFVGPGESSCFKHDSACESAAEDVDAAESCDHRWIRLAELQAEFADVVVRLGVGIEYVDIEFQPPLRTTSRLLRLLAAQQSLPWILASYLLHRHRLRVAYGSGSAAVLRLRQRFPSTPSEQHQLHRGLVDLCQRLRAEDVCGLTQFATERRASEPDDVCEFLAPRGVTIATRKCAAGTAGETRVAWLFHLVGADDLTAQEPSFQGIERAGLEDVFRRFSRFAAPMALDATSLCLAKGRRVILQPILLPVTSRTMKAWLDARHLASIRRLLASGVDLAHRLECDVIALGQFTSIVTRNGTSLARQLPPGIGLTTGNSYTVCLAIQALEKVWRERNIQPQEKVLLVGGTLGNIGRVLAELLAPRFRRTILLGSARPGSRERLEQFRQQIPRATISTDPRDALQAQVIAAALNAVTPTFEAAHLGRGAIVCDVSVPSAVDANLAALRPDVTLVRGGIARIPVGEDLAIPCFPLPPGLLFGCMAEGLLLGLEGIRDQSFTGPLTAAHVQRVASFAERHGFELADAQGHLPWRREERHVPS